MVLIEKNGLKVGLFCWFQHPPEWEHGLTKLRCLEHNQESTIVSLWDENLIKQYDKFYKDLSEKYRDRIGFLYVGVYGDYGEVVFPAGVKHYKFSPPHNHQGFWCGDKLARADYRKYLEQKYKNVENLNKSWNTDFKSLDDDLMPKMPFAKNPLQMRMDFADWYTGSLMNFTDKVCKTARKYFPNTPMGLPIGFLSEDLRLGQQKSLAVKIAAQNGILARWTGLAYTKEFPLTNVSTRRVSSAARFYGAKFGVEAAIGVSDDKVAAAVYEALANSCSMLHNDPMSIFAEKEQYEKYKPYIKCLPVYCTLAVYYPYKAEIYGCINTNAVYREFADVREHSDYDIADDQMISDGFLNTVKDLFLPNNCPITASTAAFMRDWERKGGRIWYMKGHNPRTLETGNILELGKPLDTLDYFGKKDGCYYTDHGDSVSKYDPSKKSIEILKK